MPIYFHNLIQQATILATAQLVRLGIHSSITIASLFCSLCFIPLFLKLRLRFNRWIVRKICLSNAEKRIKREILLISKYVLYPMGLFIFFRLLGIDRWLFEELNVLQTEVKAIVDLKLFTIGKTELTLWTVLYLLVLSWLLVRVTGQCENWFINRVLSRTRLETGMSNSLSAILRYVAVGIGMIVIIQSAGIDLSALTIMAGGLAVAIGLALQSLMNNIISGLVILFERPIKVGDRVDIGAITGDVSHVSLRATTIVTNDNIAIIVPNSEFITSKVVNWTYTGRQCRFAFQLRVAADSDPKQVKELLLQLARDDKSILAYPAPEVLFEERTDTSLNFSLLVWSSEYVNKPAKLRSNFNFAVADKLAQYGIKPQPVKEGNLVSIKGRSSLHDLMPLA